MITRKDTSLSAIVAKNIKYLGLFRHYEMKELEHKLGVSPGYISRCMNGKRHLSIDVVWAASKLFDTDLDDFIETNYEELWKDEQ